MHRNPNRLIRQGMSVVLTAAMMTSSLPVTALAAEATSAKAAVTAGLGDVPASSDKAASSTSLTADQAAQLLAEGSTQLPDPTAMPEIADGTYTVNVETRDAANPSNLSMSANTVSRQAKLVAKDGKVTLTIDFKAWDNQVFGDVYLGGLYYYNKSGVKTAGKVIDTQKNEDGTPVKDKFSSYLSAIGVSEYPDHVEIPLSDTTVVNNYFKLGVFVPVMESLSAGQGSKDALLNVDWSSLKAESTKPETSKFAPEKGKTYELPVNYVKDDGGDFQSHFINNPRVKATWDGSKWGVVFTLDGIAFTWPGLNYGADKKAAEQVGTDPAAYKVTLDSVDAIAENLDVELQSRFGDAIPATVSFDTSSIPASSTPSAPDKAALNDAIAAAKKVEQGSKTDDAYKALQDAIAAAEKVAGDEAATQDGVDAAVKALNKAVEDFKASAEKPQGALQDGALYEVPVSIVNDEIEKPNIVELSMEKLFSKGQKALVTYKDGKYTVQITTLYTGSNGVSDVEYGADNAVATKASSTADTITWNLTVDTLDDLHIVGNWVSSGSGKKSARAKGTIGFDASSAVKVSATDEQKGALTDAIAEAKKVKQGKKSVTAFQKLTDAIASAEKVAANSFATADQTTGATDSVKKAVEDFNASADVTTNPKLKDGSYNVSLNIAVPHPNAVSSSYDHPEWDGAREFISKAISTKAKVVVKDGKYTLSLSLDTVASYDPTAGSMWPAIGKVQYYTGYDIKDGVATGKLADATINSYITWSGSDEHVSNKYGTDYPANISIPLDSKVLTRDDATLPLEVSIPHFKANGYGTGTEQVMAQIDWSTAINTDELSGVIDSAKKVKQGTKTLSAFEDLQDAISAAEKVLNGGSKVQSDYDNATAALQKAIDTFNDSAEASKLDKDTLAPGTYEVQLEMFGYSAPDVHSMSDGSVEHTAQVVVDDEGNYSLVITTKGQYMAQYGGTFYMGAFNMYDDDGTTVIPGTVLDTVKNKDGSEYTDQFNTGDNPVQKGAYPAKVSLPLSKKAIDAEAGRVKVQVFVPVMESLMGNGHQDAYARIDWTTLTAKDVKPTEVDTTALKAAIADAQKVEQGNKTNEAFKTLQDAIAEAKKVASAAKDQDTVDAAVDTLNKAVETFKNSPDKPADLEAGKVYTAKAKLFTQDGTTEFSTVLLDLDKVEVRKNADGKYEADISTVPGYISASYNFKLSDGFDGTEPTIVWQSGNDYTFRVTGDSLDNLQAHLTYTGGMMGGTTDEKLVIKLSDANEEKVDKSALADAIKNAPEQGNKTDEAFKTLAAAKKAAKKVADQADATTAEVKTALSTFQAAVEAFNKSEDAKPEVNLEEGKTYSVPVAYKRADKPSVDSMSGGFFKDKATVTRSGDTYTVTLITNLTAEQKDWLSDFKVGDQTATVKQVDENNVSFTFTTGDISKAIEVSVHVQPMNSSPKLLVVLDASKAEEVKPEAADTSKLEAAIKDAKAVEQGSKTDEAFAKLQEAIKAAQAVVDSKPTDQKVVDEAVSTLNKAVEDFKASADKPVTPSFDLEAGKVYTATGTFYDEKGETPSKPMAGFFAPTVEVVKLADGTYEVYVATKEAGVKTSYNLSLTTGFGKDGKADVVYSKSVGDASTFYAYRVTGGDPSGLKVHVSYETGVAAFPKGDHDLVLKLDASTVAEEQVDKSALTGAIAKVPADKGSKTDEAFAKLTEAKAAAQKVADDKDATKYEVAAAADALAKAVDEFNKSEDAKPEAADTSKLEAAIKDAKAIEQGNKTDEAWKAFQDAIATAQKVVDSKPTNQSIVDSATNALEIATSTFQNSENKPVQADKTKLNEAIAAAKKIEQGKKSADAFNSLQVSIKLAEAIAADVYADQNTVDVTTKQLESAVAIFNVSADVTTSGSGTTGTTNTTKPSTTTSNKTTTTTKGNSKALPQTSDATSIAGLAATAVAGLGALGAGVAARLRGRKKRQ